MFVCSFVYLLALHLLCFHNVAYSVSFPQPNDLLMETLAAPCPVADLTTGAFSYHGQGRLKMLSNDEGQQLEDEKPHFLNPLVDSPE